MKIVMPTKRCRQLPVLTLATALCVLPGMAAQGADEKETVSSKPPEAAPQSSADAAQWQRMQERLQALRNTTDPFERRRLMQEQMADMHELMGMPAGPGMMGGYRRGGPGMMGPGYGGGPRGMGPGPYGQCPGYGPGGGYGTGPGYGPRFGYGPGAGYGPGYGSGMMGPGAGRMRGPMGGVPGESDFGADSRLDMMEDRLSRMEMMVEQMLQNHQEMLNQQ